MRQAIERRRAARVELGVTGYYRPFSRGGALLLLGLRPARIEDLGPAGAFVTDVPYLALGTEVEIHVPLGDGGPALRAFGRVVRVDLAREGGYGLRFLPLTEDDERRLRSLVAWSQRRRAFEA